MLSLDQALKSCMDGSTSLRLVKQKDRCQNHPIVGHTLGWAYAAPDQEAGWENEQETSGWKSVGMKEKYTRKEKRA